MHTGQLGQHVGHRLQLGPVQLQIGAGGEVAIAPVVVTGQVTQLAQLVGGQHSIRDGDAQHWRMALNIEPILYPQGQELVVAEASGQIAFHLIAKLSNALSDQCLIMGVITIHSADPATEKLA